MPKPLRLTARSNNLTINASSQKLIALVTNSARDGGSDGLAPYDCEAKPLNSQTWKELSIDSYISTYPNGAKLSLQDFARENGASNFNCVFGGMCHAGQLCAPVTGRAWYVLFAAQQYSSLQKSAYDAIDFAGSTAATTGSALIRDMFDQKAKQKFFVLHKVGMILTVLAGVVAIMLSIAFIWAPTLSVFAATAAVAAAMAVTQSTVLLKAQNQARVAGKEDPFTRWAAFTTLISDWQQKTQNATISNMTRHIEAGVSSPDGISAIIKNGTYCSNVQAVSTFDMEKNYKNIIVARLINHVFHMKHAFVTIGSDPCNKGGPNGAFKIEDGRLSYCDASKTMMNVVFAKGKKTGNNWFNANLIPTRYNTTVQYIVEQSLACQKHWGPGHDPYASGALPKDINSECLINLPVCDTRDKKFRDEAGDSTTVQACRKLQKLNV